MPNWHQLSDEIKEAGSAHDIVRRKYLLKLHELTGRNVIVYYSGWLQKQGVGGLQVNDADKNGFMTTIHGLDRSKGLDLILHTPGGEVAATESIVDYLRSMFGSDIRAIIPQLAMSAGTMISCACKEIMMGKHSSLGPIDPQFNGIPAHGILEEFARALAEIKQDQLNVALWQPIIAKYSPTLIGECEKAVKWSSEMVTSWLKTGMFDGDPEVDQKVHRVLNELGDHALNLSHARHLSAQKCKAIGLKVIDLEEFPEVQDAVLSIHHSCVHSMASTNAIKIIENHEGVAFIQAVQPMVQAMQPMPMRI